MVLTNKEIAFIMKDHDFKTEEVNGKIFGFIPSYNTITKAEWDEKTELTGFSVKKIRDYLGY